MYIKNGEGFILVFRSVPTILHLSPQLPRLLSHDVLVDSVCPSPPSKLLVPPLRRSGTPLLPSNVVHFLLPSRSTPFSFSPLIDTSLTQRESLEELIGLHDQIIRVKEPHTVPFVLVGSECWSPSLLLEASRLLPDDSLLLLLPDKCDLAADREIDTSEGQDLADAWGCPFYETSARTNINVSIVFEDVVRQIRKHAPPERTSPGSPIGGQRRRGKKSSGTRKCVIL